MGENLRPADEGPLENQQENQPEEEQTHEQILDVLESAFERGIMANITVAEPSGELRTNAVFIEGLGRSTLFVSSSKESPVMGIPIDNIKRAEAES